jgi:inner membrane protein involved in colicin E2 resistance
MGIPLLFAALVAMMYITRETTSQADAATHEAQLDGPIAVAS